MHLFNQTFDDRHAKPSSLVNTTRIIFLLCKRIKDVIQKFLAHANSRVRDRPPIDAPAVPYILRLHPGTDFSARTIVFDAVSINIQENLAQMELAAINIRIRNLRFPSIILPLNARIYRALDDDAHDIARHLCQ